MKTVASASFGLVVGVVFSSPALTKVEVDCSAPPIIKVFGDENRCRLVAACRERMQAVSVPIPADVQSTCEKVLADWKRDEAAMAKAQVSPQEDEIRKLVGKKK